jgi:hypothetical protein
MDHNTQLEPGSEQPGEIEPYGATMQYNDSDSLTEIKVTAARTDGKIDVIGTKLDQMLSRHHEFQTAFDKHVEENVAEFEKVHGKVNGVDDRVSDVDKKVSKIFWTTGAIISTLIALDTLSHFVHLPGLGT